MQGAMRTLRSIAPARSGAIFTGALIALSFYGFIKGEADRDTLTGGF